MSEDFDRAPAFLPFIVTLTWTVGDSLEVDCGDLEGWEVMALLDQAREVIQDAERADTEAEGEDAEA
jgi:hypothetical protein